MDKWLIPSILILLIIMILLPIVALLLGIIASIFICSLIYFNYCLPPPYLSVNQDLDIVINWLSRKADETVVILKIASGIIILNPDKKIFNEFTGKNAVNSLTIKKTLGITPGVKIKYIINKISELPFSLKFKDKIKDSEIIRTSFSQNRHSIFRWNRDYWFRVPMPSIPSNRDLNNGDSTLKVSVIGDVQPKSNMPPLLQMFIMWKIKKQQPDLFLYLGDHTNEGIDWRGWNQFYHIIGVIASHTPVLGVPGNHDTALSRKGGLRKLEDAYQTYINYPAKKRYFLEIYGIQLFAFDFLSGFSIDSENYRLLQENQEKLSKEKWIITIWHSSPYNSVRVGGDVLNIREHFLPVLNSYGCRLWLGGHEHAYQRFKVGETYYITTAATSGFHKHRASDEGMEKILMHFHYTMLHIQPNQIRLQAISIRNKVIDEILISK